MAMIKCEKCGNDLDEAKATIVKGKKYCQSCAASAIFG